MAPRKKLSRRSMADFMAAATAVDSRAHERDEVNTGENIKIEGGGSDGGGDQAGGERGHAGGGEGGGIYPVEVGGAGKAKVEAAKKDGKDTAGATLWLTRVGKDMKRLSGSGLGLTHGSVRDTSAGGGGRE